MRVIGKTDDGYLISASDKEIARLMGYYWTGENRFKAELSAQGLQERDLCGFVFDPDPAYEQLSWLRMRNSEFDKLCEKLRQTADIIQAHRQLFDQVIQDGQISELSTAAR